MWLVRYFARKWFGRFLGEIEEKRAMRYMGQARIAYFLLAGAFFLSVRRNIKQNETQNPSTSFEDDPHRRIHEEMERQGAEKGLVYRFGVGVQGIERYDYDREQYLKYLESRALPKVIDKHKSFLESIEDPDLDVEQFLAD